MCNQRFFYSFKSLRVPKNVFKSNLALAAVLNLVSTMMHIGLHYLALHWNWKVWTFTPDPDVVIVDHSPRAWLLATRCPEIVLMWWTAIATFTATFLIEFDRFLAIA